MDHDVPSENEMIAITSTARVNQEFTLRVTVPAEAIQKLKTAQLIGMSTKTFLVECEVTLLPDKFDTDDFDLF